MKLIITESTVSKIQIIQDLKNLAPLFAAAAQKIYDGWSQDDEGYDEEFSVGGICDAIAEEICSIINSKSNYNCFTFYDESATHRSVYVYECLEPDEDGTPDGYLISVDIPYYFYEKGYAYNWTKIPNVTFTPDAVEIHDVSGYYENFVDTQTCEPYDN